MENLSNNFGERLRHLIAMKGESQGEFAQRYGIAESQLYNWLKREAPPLPKHWERLADYFACPREYVAFGTPPIPEQSRVFAVQEDLPPPYGALREVTAEESATGEAAELSAQIRAQVDRSIVAARGDVGRLGWLREQAEQHLRPPERWLQGLPEPKRPPATVVLVPPAQLAQPQRRPHRSG